MFPNETALVVANVISIQTWGVKSILRDRVESRLKEIQKLRLLEKKDGLAPKILDNPK
jgi:hypothetical protein